MPKPVEGPCCISLRGESGQAWIGPHEPVLVQGTNAVSSPVFPDFPDRPELFVAVIERLMRACATGGPVQCSGHDYHQALEVAIALELSAQRGHEGVTLPLEDRSHRLFPQPYRMHGGDALGWKNTDYRAPPELEPS